MNDDTLTNESIDSDEIEKNEDNNTMDDGDIVYMLSTYDNPYDYFTQRKEWLSFDIEHQYDCCGKLARIARLTDDMTESEENEEIKRAIDEIIKYDFLNIYKRVSNKDRISA